MYDENKQKGKWIKTRQNDWVFKIDGKQLYELPLQLLMKEYEAFGQTDIQM